MTDILVSINIISLGRDTLYTTLASLYSQIFPYPFEINLIVQGKLDQGRIIELNIHNITTHIYFYEYGLGFGYYRNQAIEKSHGDILVWIDDDEWTKNDQWLIHITKPIIDDTYKVVTGGYMVGLGKGYLTDCISLLGYPGGGALGFAKMWSVNGVSETTHICTGNFAFHRSILDSVGLFNEELIYGTEDVAFADKIITYNTKILYEKAVDVFHIHRSGIFLFCRWHFFRGKASYQFMNLSSLKSHHKTSKLYSLKNILGNPSLNLSYRIGVCIFCILQYVCQGLGYFYYSIFKR